ncbi:hypothetical protein Mlab_1196 [Methanocorpusculum labreanum Z]|uniref:Uncharacterized protein n=1 Tax=Methanocorpusculum labreanum (strain ATCC 43576 / DSM 4855 / Z) TaxID=410358 RepID=A2SSQ9_METLZ|nr:hypothetical protein [Methanocorpusculum labreanum]ABN07365.1 hypothetical protein Mlab_1196 [Methanocorpusculum labreanum Z]
MAESSAPTDSPAPTDLEALLLEWRPVPDEAFAAAFRYQEFLYCMKELTTLFEERHTELIGMIRSEGLASDEFVLEIPTDRVVNTSLLQDELPDVYDELVFIRPSDAKRFIGLAALYDLAVETAGRDRVAKVERVNLLDLKKALPADEAARYVKEVPHESLAKVVRAGE